MKRRVASSSSTTWSRIRRTGLPDHRGPVELAGARRPGDGPDDGPPDHPRSVREHDRGAREVLGVDAELRDAAARDARADRAEPDRPSTGQLQEWLEDIDDPNEHHRHVSHLWGLYPGREITRAARRSCSRPRGSRCELRGDGGTGWSEAWKINFWARLLDGDHALPLLDNLLRAGRRGRETRTADVYPNLFDAHPPFQIDGNFGAAPPGSRDAAAEPRAASSTCSPRCRRLADRRVTGLRARGGFEVDLAWSRGALTRARVISRLGGPLRVRYRGVARTYETTPGQRVDVLR